MKQIILLFLISLVLLSPNLAQEIPMRIRIGKAIKLQRPPFPSGCRCKFSKVNKVSVQFTVDKEGNVDSAKGIAGHPLLRAASVAAIRNSKFTISSISYKPVAGFGIITYEFVLSKNKWKSHVVNYELKLEKNM